MPSRPYLSPFIWFIYVHLRKTLKLLAFFSADAFCLSLELQGLAFAGGLIDGFEEGDGAAAFASIYG